MASIKSAQRSALVAIAPNAPYLAAGTMAGAVDLSFSSSANLEIFKLDFQSDAPDLPIVATLPSPDRFNRLSWSKPVLSDEFSLGLVAGGLSDGSIGVWNPLTMINSEDQDAALVGRLEKHVGPVRGLEFSTVAPNMLASGADEGEICIWDLTNPSEPQLFPSLKGAGSGAQTEVSYVSWNNKVDHILASTSYNGITAVWDLRLQKQLTSISDSNRRRGSVVQWKPDFSAYLIVASDDDNSPSVRLWDVRKITEPVREFVGHTKGVIAMSWCPYDSSYLLTCAKDNRTICWDTNTGEIVSELPGSTNGNFDVHWYPKIPGVISASSFDVKIGIYNIESCGRYTAADGSQARLTAPKWLKCPAGASFGFGGKFVSFRPNPANTPNSEVYVHELVTEHNLVTRSTEFETLIKNGEKTSLRALCDKKAEESLSEDERETWAFLKVMFEEEGTARTKLLSHLGFTVPETLNDSTDDLSNTLSETLNLDSTTTNKTTNIPNSPSLLDEDADDFFNNPPPVSEEQPTLTSTLEELTPLTLVNGSEETKQTGEVLEGSNSEVDESIQRALVVGDYKGAVEQCVNNNRMADALVIAHVGGAQLWENTRNQYLKNSTSSYLKILSAMVGNDLMTLVDTWPLNSWKETLALLCTFAQKGEWTMLCDSLASRLLSVGNTLAATLCYICAGNIDKTVEIWSQNLKSNDGSKTYVDLLQDLMEKTITLALATEKKFSPSISKLVENYAELLASQGLLSTAMEYVKLLGSEDSSLELSILRDRIANSAEIEKVESRSFPAEQQAGSYYGADQSSIGSYDNYQVQQQQSYQQQSYGASYTGGYAAPAQQKPQYQDYTHNNPVPSFQPTLQKSPYQDYTQNNPVPSFQPAVQKFPYQDYTQTNPVPSFQPSMQKSQYQEYAQSNPVPSFQPAVPTPHMFVPSQPQHAPAPPQSSFMPQSGAQASMKAFVPSNAPVLKNAEQYQQPTTLGAQLYPGLSNPAYQANIPPAGPTPPMTGGSNIPSHQFPHAVSTNPPAASRFTPAPPGQQMPGQQFMPRPNMTGTQPSSPSMTAVQQQQTAPAVAPPAPPPTVQTADTSKVSAEMRPVINTLTRLFEETSRALGGPQANPAKKREIEDNSKKIGALFAKLNTGDISPNAASKLTSLCSALDNGDFASAMHIQVLMTTSDWDECNFWLSALKRMIKTRQSLRL